VKLVVTGALGHIGSHLLRRVPALFPGAEVVMVDNLATQRFCSLFNLPEGARFRLVQADVLEVDLAALLDGADALIHLAAITDAESSVNIPEPVERVNFGGTVRVAEACQKAGVPMVFLSTTSVYGSQAELVDEECPIEQLKPQSPYAASKLKAEQFLQARAREGLGVVVFRFGTIFGASIGMRFHTAVNKFCWQAVVGQPVTVWRTALNQVRPYLDIEDAVRAIAYAVRTRLFAGGLYNVVTCNATVRSITELIRAHRPALDVQLVDTRIMNQLSYQVSAKKLEATGFRHQGSLERGIAETVALLSGRCPRALM